MKGLLERLNNGEIVIWDGGFVFALEKRGYVKAGPWTPEAVIENPEAGRKKLSKLHYFCQKNLAVASSKYERQHR